MTTSTDLRYGRRGGGWVPNDRKRETPHPHRLRPAPCPRTDCGGVVHLPLPRPTSPYAVTCDGIWKHTFDVTPLAPHTAPKDTTHAGTR